jgi:hypothetical protein
MQSISRGTTCDYVQAGYVFFGNGQSGFIRDATGRKPFNYCIAEHDGGIWIDIIAQNAKTLGICELSDNTDNARLCFQFSESGSDLVRPKSFEEADTQGYTIITLRRIKSIPSSADLPAAKADIGYYSGQDVPADVAPPVPQKALVVLGPQIPSDREGVLFIPGPPPMPDNPLRGRWTAHFDPAGPDRFETGELFAFFGNGFGLLSDVRGTGPNTFRFYLAEKDGQLQIDLTFSADWGCHVPQPGEVETQYGICELSNGRAYICFCGKQYHAANGRPRSFKEADPAAYTKIILTSDVTCTQFGK